MIVVIIGGVASYDKLVLSPGSLNIPPPQLHALLGGLPGNSGSQVFCCTGQRGHCATRILLQNGVKARNFAGGMLTRAMLRIAPTT